MLSPLPAAKDPPLGQKLEISHYMIGRFIEGSWCRAVLQKVMTVQDWTNVFRIGQSFAQALR